MDTSLTNRKNGILEVAKIISKSNLFERQLENNKPIKVQIKAKNDLIYHDLTPNKERTKKIMSSFLKPNHNKINHHRVNSDTLSNNNNNHKIQKILSINNKIKNGTKINLDKEIDNYNNNISNYKNKEINCFINDNNFNENDKNNIYNQIKVNKNNIYNVNYDNNNIEKIKNFNTLYKKSNFNDSKRIFETIENTLMKDYKNHDDNIEHLNTITANGNNNSINKISFNNRKQLKKNIITKRIILTQSESKINITNQSQNKSFINNLSENNEITKKSHLKKSNSTFISRNNNNTISNEETFKENNNPITILKIEDLIVLEEKIFNIVNSFEIESPHPSLCIEWWNFYSYTSFCGKFENFFNKEKNNYEFQIAHETIILELLSIILIYEILRDSSITHSIFNLLKKLINEIYQNYLIVCNYILTSINIKTNTNIWINKLLNIISSKLKKKINNKNDNISQLKIGNNVIYSLISNIFKQNQNSRNKINTVSLNNYFKKINSISINTLNEYFIKKINIDYSKTGDSLSYIINDSISDQKKITIPYLDKKLSNGKDFTLVLDLDDTLINYKLDEKGRGILRPRPNLYNFLNEMRQIFEMILFTAGTSEYADPILNIIDKKKIFFDKILYRQHTIIMDNVFVKDLSKLGRDLSKVIIIDNMPQSFKLQKENGIFIKSFNGDNKKDSTLFDLIPILKKIAGNSNNDVRVELNKMKNEIFTKITTNLQNED